MNYDTLLTAIGFAHQEALQKAVRAVNRQLILRNWLIGAYLVQSEQKGEARAFYEDRLLKQMTTDLSEHQITGFSHQTLDLTQLFFRSYPQTTHLISSPVVSLPAQATQGSPVGLARKKVLLLSWLFIVELLSIEDPWTRAFYENTSLKGKWSKRKIASPLYERTGRSSDKETLINPPSGQASESPHTVIDIVHDPYIIDFIGLAGRPSYLKKDLETALLDPLQTFLLEPCNGLCFEARKSAFPSATRTTTSILSFTTAFSAATSSLN